MEWIFPLLICSLAFIVTKIKNTKIQWIAIVLQLILLCIQIVVQSIFEKGANHMLRKLINKIIEHKELKKLQKKLKKCYLKRSN